MEGKPKVSLSLPMNQPQATLVTSHCSSLKNFAGSTLWLMNSGKGALKTFFGGLPSASLPTAIDYFEKARKADPNYLLNYLDLAKAYKKNGQSDKAIDILNRLIKLPPRTADDNGYKAEGKILLESLL